MFYQTCTKRSFRWPKRVPERVLVTTREVLPDGGITEVVSTEILDTAKGFQGLKASDFSLDTLVATGNTDLLKPVGKLAVDDFRAADSFAAAAAVPEVSSDSK